MLTPATGTTYSRDGQVLGPGGIVLRQPADSPCLLHLAMCAANCNDSAFVYNREKGRS